MNLRDRVLKVFRYEELQPVPYTIWYDHEALDMLNRYYGNCEWQNQIQNHILRITVNWQPRHYLDKTKFIDIYGTLWQEGKPIHIIEPVLKEPDLRGFHIPDYVPYVLKSSSADPDNGYLSLPHLSYKDACRRFQDEQDKVFCIVGYGFGLFESAWIIRGFEQFFADLLLNPNFAHGLLDMLLERHLGIVDILTKLPCDGILFSDDYGDQNSVIIGPKLWRKFIQPRLAKLYERVSLAGKMTFQHTCGNVFEIIPDLIDVGLDVLQGLQPEAMSVYEIKRHFGKSLRLWGGLGTQRLLPFASPENIRAEVQSLKRELGRGGGYVFSSSKPIMKDVPLENAIALIEEATAS